MRASILVFLATAIGAVGGCEKYELDRQMEELCKKDGGVRVYETVTLPPEMFDQNGEPFPGWATRPPEDRVGPDYRLTWSITDLKRGEPLRGEGRLSQHRRAVVRLSDNKVLGESISYGRSGGDFIVLGHFTSKTCPPGIGGSAPLIHAVFIKRGN